MIRKCRPGDAEPGKDVCLYTHDGKRLLGRHENRQRAHIQEAAIKYAQARRNPSDDLPTIYVLSLDEVSELFRLGRTENVGALLSIGDLGAPDPWFLEPACEQGIEVLRLDFDDTVPDNPDGDTPPDEEDVRLIVEFLEEMLDGLDEGEIFLIHCNAGISRSTAAAALAWAIVLPEASPREIAERVLNDRPGAWPNEWMLELGAPLLGRDVEELLQVQEEISDLAPLDWEAE